MNKFKNLKYVILVCIGITFSTPPCYAFGFPTFDIAEVGATIKGIITDAQSLVSTVQSTISQSKLLQSLGDAVSSIKKFRTEHDKEMREALQAARKLKNSERLKKLREKLEKERGGSDDGWEDEDGSDNTEGQNPNQDNGAGQPENEENWNEGAWGDENGAGGDNSSQGGSQGKNDNEGNAGSQGDNSSQDGMNNGENKENAEEGSSEDADDLWGDENSEASGDDLWGDENGLPNKENSGGSSGGDSMYSSSSSSGGMIDTASSSSSGGMIDTASSSSSGGMIDTASSSSSGGSSGGDSMYSSSSSSGGDLATIKSPKVDINTIKKPTVSGQPASFMNGGKSFKIPTVRTPFGRSSSAEDYINIHSSYASSGLTVYTGTNDEGRFLYSDVIATKCKLNWDQAEDVEKVKDCIKTWVDCMNNKEDAGAGLACREEYKKAIQEQVAGELASALQQKEYSASFDTESAKKMETLGEDLINERSDVSFTGEIGRLNQEILLRMMYIMAGKVLQDSVAAIPEIKPEDFVEE